MRQEEHLMHRHCETNQMSEEYLKNAIIKIRNTSAVHIGLISPREREHSLVTATMIIRAKVITICTKYFTTAVVEHMAMSNPL